MRGFVVIGLYYPKSHLNVGSVLRAAGCFRVKGVVIEGQRYKAAPTDVAKMVNHIPLTHSSLKELIPFGAVPVAVDLVEGAKSLHSFTHPDRAFYIFGPEDGSIPLRVLEWCQQRVYIPCKGCLNIAAAVNVVLYDRDKKRTRDERTLDRNLHERWSKILP